MLSCKDVTELCSRALEEPLPFHQRWRLQCQLMMCSGCGNFRRQMFTLRDLARRYAGGDAPSDGEGDAAQQ